MSLFGPIVGADDVRDGVRDHLRTWMPTYVAEVARQAGLDPADLPGFQRYDVRTDNDTLPAYDELPALQVLCDELIPRLADGDGDVYADATVQIRIYAAGSDEESTTQSVARYVKAVRAAILQHRDIGDIASGAQWTGEGYAEPVPDERYEAWGSGGLLLFTVAVNSPVTNVYDGPDVVPADPTADPGDAPTVLTPSTLIAPEES